VALDIAMNVTEKTISGISRLQLQPMLNVGHAAIQVGRVVIIICPRKTGLL
jgi:hypothetical protein